MKRQNPLQKATRRIETEYRSNPERLRKACYEMTGIDVAETTTTDRRESA